ncbi:MAG: phosphoglycerate dehydrogenase [Acidimicrobiia bacterium]|nr:phosphoglycerate dehydrogenase [Acidimicrobiia bacterium]
MPDQKFRVLVSDKLGQDGLTVLEQAEDITVDVNTGLSEDELCDIIGDYDALIVRSGTQVTAKVMDRGARLKVVGRAGVGIDNVAVDEATRHGILVMNTPEANTTATAEHAMALLMATARNVVAAHNSLAAGRWERSSFTGTELGGKTLGVVGFGRVGRAVAVRAQAFGMSILAYDPFVSERVAKTARVELVDLEELLSASDFVTLHTSLTDETRNLINRERLALMKPTATIINAARGGLVDPGAVAEALDADRLRAIALDVFATEPPEADHPLVNHPKVVHTPHLGASTTEAQRSVAIEIAEQVIDALRGTRITNCVNLAFAPGLDFERVNAFITLASKMGRLQAAMADHPIESVELELYTDDAEDLMRPVAAGLLKGLLESVMPGTVNFINAPLLARDRGLKISRSVGLGNPDHLNQITCRVRWNGGLRTVAGAIFGDDRGRIVQISGYHLEAEPNGTVLLLLNADVPGVVGAVGNVFGEYGINIGEWRLGRNVDRHEALSFINLDTTPEPGIVDSLRAIDAVRKAILLEL